MRIAFATDNGMNFITRHFGDALKYRIFEITSRESVFIEEIVNNTEEEERHADPKKAKSITNLLKEKNIKVVVSKIFGPNIKRIKTKFVCVLIKEETIDDAIIAIQKNINNIQKEWDAGENRNFLKL